MSSPMFLFAPSSAYESTPLNQPQVFRQQSKPKAVSPRDRYLAALAEAKAAEAEYVEALSKEKAVQKQKEEEQRRKAALQRQREEALRRQLVVDALYQQDSASYLADDADLFYTPRYHRSVAPQYNPYDAEIEAEISLRRELERRRAIAHRQQQEALVERRRLSILRQQQQQHQQRAREQAQSLALAAAREREQQAQVDRHSEEEALEQVLSLLFGGRATVRKVPSQEQIKQPQLEVKPVSHPQGCASHCAPRPPASTTEQEDIQQFLKLMFGGKAQIGQQAGCACAHKEQPKEKVAQPSQGCRARCQAPAIPQVQKPQPVPASTSAPASTGLSLKDQLKSRLSQEPEVDVRDTLQGLLASVFGGNMNDERKEKVEKKNEPSAIPSGLSLKEQLEARLHKDPNVEVHDTVQAILNSLMTTQSTASSSPKAAKTSAEAPTPGSSSSSETATQGKGKGKAVSFEANLYGESTTAPTSKDVLDSMNAIHNVEMTFNTLSEEFNFPKHLDFTPPSSAPSSPHASDSESTLSSKLAYTANNSPVRYYEQALSALLNQLDAVESWGNEDVRKERKVVVDRVERALEEVERELQERLVHKAAIKKAEVLSAEPVLVDVGPFEKSEHTKPTSIPEVTDVPASAGTEVTAPVATEATEVPAIADDSDISTILTSSADTSIAASEETIKPFVNAKPTLESEVSVGDVLEASPVVESSVQSLSEIVFSEEKPAEKVERESASASEEPVSSYPPKSSHTSVSQTPVVPEASLGNSIVQPDSEPVDTFLLPATASPITRKQPTASDEDEAVVVDKEHGESSDGENWSEVEA